MTNTFLISEAKIREYTGVDNNVDSALIKNGIREGQDIGLQAIIGTLLYDQLMNLVDSGDINAGAYSKYKTLLDAYVQNYLVYACYWYILDEIYLRARNNGLVIPNGGENSIAAQRDMYNVKRTSVQNKMEFYAEKLTQFIIEQQVDYPELNASNKLYEENPNYSSKYGSPFVFGMAGYGNSRNTEEFIKRGYRVYNTAFKQYPQ